MSPLATRRRRPLSQWNPKRQISWEHYTGVSIEKKKNLKKNIREKKQDFVISQWVGITAYGANFQGFQAAIGTCSLRADPCRHMAGAWGAELPWELGCSPCPALAQELEQLKRSGAGVGAGPCWGLSLEQVSNGKRFHLRQNLELPNPQPPAEVLSHQLQIRPNVPIAHTMQPLIIPSKQTEQFAKHRDCSAPPFQQCSHFPSIRKQRRGAVVLRAAAIPHSSALKLTFL